MVFCCKEAGDTIAPKVIAEVAEVGFDLIEIPVQNPDEFDSALIGKRRRRLACSAQRSACPC
jgi:hypothetical protein